MSAITKCKGCGATLQTEDPKKVGFAKSEDHDYCMSCYKLLHYGEVEAHFHPEDLPSFSKDAVVFMVSSVMHLDMLFEYPVHRYEPDLKYVYLINQIDLLPDSTNFDDMLAAITKKSLAYKIPYLDIIMMSAKNPYDIENLYQYMMGFKEKNIYLIGVQNSGKTTIFKALTNDPHALSFSKAGLTQEAMMKQLESHVIWDMPGLYQEGYIHQFLPYETYKKLIPTHKINPKIYQLKKNQSLFLEGLIAITIKQNDQTVVLYLHRDINIHKTNINRINELIDKKTEMFDIYVDTYEEKSFKIPEGKTQITFADIGFMHIDGPNTISVKYPKGMHITLTEALFK